MSNKAIPTINRLPHELLVIIFTLTECGTSSMGNQRRQRKSPATSQVSQVCSLWRDIILNSSSLWTTFIVHANASGPHGFEVEPRILQHFAEKSKSSGLNITLHSLVTGFSMTESIRRLLPLLRECHRWESLQLWAYSRRSDKVPSQSAQAGRVDIGSSPVAEAFGFGSDSRLHRLKTLKLGHVGDWRIIKALQSATSLENLFIETIKTSTLTVLQRDALWPNLCTVTAPPFALLSGQQRSGWMSNLRIMVIAIKQHSHHPLPTSPFALHFPNLQDLSIHTVSDKSASTIDENELHPQDFPSLITQILKKIDSAPRLTSLSLGWTGISDFRKNRCAPHLSIDPLVQFVDRCGNQLSSLSITNLHLMPEEFQALLNAIPRLEVLQITEANMGKVGVWPRKLAMITEDLLALLTVNPTEAQPLAWLPRLKHIDFTVNEFHDQAFTNMVLSRQNAHDQVVPISSITLKLVGVGFLPDTKFFGTIPSLRKTMFVELQDLKGCVITRTYPPADST